MKGLTVDSSLLNLDINSVTDNNKDISMKKQISKALPYFEKILDSD